MCTTSADPAARDHHAIAVHHACNANIPSGQGAFCRILVHIWRCRDVTCKKITFQKLETCMVFCSPAAMILFQHTMFSMQFQYECSSLCARVHTCECAREFVTQDFGTGALKQHGCFEVLFLPKSLSQEMRHESQYVIMTLFFNPRAKKDVLHTLRAKERFKVLILA
jgi:hypothetical protein